MRKCLIFKSPPPTASFSVHSFFAALLQSFFLKNLHHAASGQRFSTLIKLSSPAASRWTLPSASHTVGPDACSCAQGDCQASIWVMRKMALQLSGFNFEFVIVTRAQRYLRNVCSHRLEYLGYIK
ncbi:hypothetical protein HDV63DRAFT_61098 [Trichoderma sp. SZMC 28014]